MSTAAEATSADLNEIDAFCDTLWLEDGLAKASLASYRSDLIHLARWLAAQRLPQATAHDRKKADQPGAWRHARPGWT